MIFHPGILALLIGSGLILLMLIFATAAGINISLTWDIASSRPGQIANERKTFLISAILNYGLALHILGLFLFLHTLEDIHPMFVGAMCATGSLNANPVGWTLLLLKIVIFFAAAIWIAVNFLDQRAEDFPLVRFKYWLLVPIVLLAATDFGLAIAYFRGLNPEIITSCCGSLFSSGNSRLAGEIAGLPAAPMIYAFYGTGLITVLMTIGSLLTRAAVFRFCLALLSPVFCAIGLASVISFISIYIYELPTHHCPFDILQDHYSYIGYPLYFTLFGASIFGLLPGLFLSLRHKKSLKELLSRIEKKWLTIALVFQLSFLILTTWAVLASHYASGVY